MKTKHKNGDANLLAILLTFITIVSCWIIWTTRHPGQTLSPSAPKLFNSAPSLEKLGQQNAIFKSFLEKFQKNNPQIALNKFQKTSVTPLDLKNKTVADKQNFGHEGTVVATPPKTADWIYSPDKTKALSTMTQCGEPDTSLEAYNLLNDKNFQQLEMCGTPCSPFGALWLSNTEFINATTAYYINDYDALSFAIDYYNLANGTITTYQLKNIDKAPKICETNGCCKELIH